MVLLLSKSLTRRKYSCGASFIVQYSEEPVPTDPNITANPPYQSVISYWAPLLNVPSPAYTFVLGVLGTRLQPHEPLGDKPYLSCSILLRIFCVSFLSFLVIQIIIFRIVTVLFNVSTTITVIYLLL